MRTSTFFAGGWVISQQGIGRAYIAYDITMERGRNCQTNEWLAQKACPIIVSTISYTQVIGHTCTPQLTVLVICHITSEERHIELFFT